MSGLRPPEHIAPDGPLDESETRLNRGEVSLFVRRWRPPGGSTPVATVQIIHGMTEHSGRYRHVAAALARQGWQVYGHDHRGHGLTASDLGSLGLFAERGGWRRVVDDAEAVMDLACTECPSRPHAVIGHSMGSFVAQHLAIERGADLAALVLSGTDHRPGMLTWFGKVLAGGIARLWGPRHRSRIVDWLTTGGFLRDIPDAPSERAWISRDPLVIDTCLADPFCGFRPTVAMWRDILTGLYTVGQAELQRRLPSSLPVLLQVGEADPLSAGGKRVRRLAQAYRRAGLQHVDVMAYPEARHEVYNELQRDRVIADLVTWLGTRLDPSVAAQ